MGVRNDDSDFDAFAASAWPRLHRSAVLLVGDHYLAEDLAQEALARTFLVWRRVGREEPFGYARKILVNLSIDRHRRRRVTEVRTDADRPSVARYAVEDVDEAVRLLAPLTDQERRIVVLRYYFDLAEATVAADLRVSVGTVKSTASRALAKLREALPVDQRSRP